MRVNKNKKGVSPLIATVLLIGFTIVLAALVFQWGIKFFKDTTSFTQCQSDAKLICGQEVSISLGKVTYNAVDETVTGVVVNNEGAVQPITSFDVKIRTKNGEAKTIRVTPNELPAGESVEVISASAPLNFGITETEIDTVEVIPIINHDIADGGSCTVTCTGSSVVISHNGRLTIS